jgi:hypothetical protein
MHADETKAFDWASNYLSVRSIPGGISMAQRLRRGDRVTWNTSQGSTSGTIQKELKAPTHVKGHRVAAAPDHPEYLVKSDKTGKPAAHRAQGLKKISKKG